MTRRSLCNRRQALGALAGLAGLAAWSKASAQGASAAPSASSASGPEVAAPSWQTLDFDWHDPVRDRPVPVRLHLPQAVAADPAARVPLVVFSHGIGGSRRGYRYLGTHWARHGIASLHLQHVGSDRSLWSGSVFSLVSRLQDAAQEREALDRVQDLRFALDTLLSSALGERLDASRIAAAGHSYGANTTLLATGARVEREGRAVELRDPRLRAGIMLSAPPFYGESSLQRVLAPVSVPTLHITATEDIIRIPGYYSGADDRVAVFEAIGGPEKVLAMFEGGSHSVFTDRAGTGGAVLNPQIKRATQDLSLAFLRRCFDGEERALATWPQQHRNLIARFERRLA
ncbi:MAG: alpha/beta hydrolase family protein [Rubrivivax sp.]|jgi:predicted dienelactone hydrolase